MGRPVTITTLGLCLGFLAFTASPLKNTVEFGLLGAFTLAFAWLVDVTFTPALCSGMRVATLWDERRAQRVLCGIRPACERV